MIRSRHTNPVDETPLDPAMQAELDALDAALRGESIADDQLASLVRDVQAQAPAMPPELRTQLRDDVAAGFSRKARRGKAAGRRQVPSRLTIAMGSTLAVASVAVLTFVLVGQQGSYDTFSAQSAIEPMSSSSSTSSAPPQKAAAGSASAGASESSASALADTAAAAPAAATDRLTPATGKRKVEQSVNMAVRVKSGKLDEAAGKVNDITRAAGGFVADSQVSLGTRGAGQASFTLQVATAKLDAAIDQLSDLGTVTSQDQQSTDITSSFDSVSSRLADAKQVRRALLRALGKADTSSEIASLRMRIADNRATIASLERQLTQLSRRTDLTTVALALEAPTAGAATSDDGNWSIGDAASDAVHLLGTVAGALLVIAAGLLPLALLGALGYAVYRVRRKRRREAALDAKY